MKVVRVTWLDHREDHVAWQTYDEACKATPAVCHTVGYLVHEDDDRIVLTSTWLEDDDETVGGTLTLVQAAVRNVEVLDGDRDYRTSLLAELAERWRNT